MEWLLSTGTGNATFNSDTALFTLARSFSNPNSGEWTPITTRPASLYFAAQALMYGSSRRLFIHEYVQKFTSTTLPRTDLLVSGVELIQSTAPWKSGRRPASPVAESIATIPHISARARTQCAGPFIGNLRSQFLRLAARLAARFYQRDDVLDDRCLLAVADSRARTEVRAA